MQLQVLALIKGIKIEEKMSAALSFSYRVLLLVGGSSIVTLFWLDSCRGPPVGCWSPKMGLTEHIVLSSMSHPYRRLSPSDWIRGHIRRQIGLVGHRSLLASCGFDSLKGSIWWTDFSVVQESTVTIHVEKRANTARRNPPELTSAVSTVEGVSVGIKSTRYYS